MGNIHDKQHCSNWPHLRSILPSDPYMHARRSGPQCLPLQHQNHKTCGIVYWIQVVLLFRIHPWGSACGVVCPLLVQNMEHVPARPTPRDTIRHRLEIALSIAGKNAIRFYFSLAPMFRVSLCLVGFFIPGSFTLLILVDYHQSERSTFLLKWPGRWA